LGDYRDQAARVLETPSVSLAGVAPRYERLACYLDFSGWDDPGYSSKRLSEGELEMLESASREGSEDDLERGLRAALHLTGLRHPQLAGAAESLEFLERGSKLALAYFSDPRTWKRRPQVIPITTLGAGLLVAGLAGHWDSFEEICNLVPPKVASAGFCDDDEL